MDRRMVLLVTARGTGRVVLVMEFTLMVTDRMEDLVDVRNITDKIALDPERILININIMAVMTHRAIQ